MGRPHLALLSPTFRNSPPGGPIWHPSGQRSDGGSQESWRPVVDWRRRAGSNVHAPHFQPAPGDTKNSSATLAEHPAGRRPPTPAPRATKEVTLGGRGAAPWRPLPQRLDARQTREATAAESPPPRCQAPAQDAGGLSRRLPSSGRQAQPVLIPTLKLNIRAARRPPRRWRGRRRQRRAPGHTPVP